jgi:hypothetical protein
MNMMMPGMEEGALAQEAAAPTEAVEQIENIPTDDIAEVKEQEAAAQVEALESDATRQMVMEPFADEAKEQEALALQPEQKQEPVTEKKKNDVGPEDILGKNERIFWNVVSWAASIFAVVGGYEFLMTMKQWYKGNSIPSIMREQINSYNEFMQDRPHYRNRLFNRVYSALQSGDLPRGHIAANTEMENIRAEVRAVGHVQSGQLDLAEQVLGTRLAQETAAIGQDHPLNVQDIATQIADTRLVEIDSVAQNGMRAGIRAMDTRTSSGFSWLLNRIGFGNCGRAWAGSYRFTNRELYPTAQ